MTGISRILAAATCIVRKYFPILVTTYTNYVLLMLLLCLADKLAVMWMQIHVFFKLSLQSSMPPTSIDASLL